jgi:hypothetical protein
MTIQCFVFFLDAQSIYCIQFIQYSVYREINFLTDKSFLDQSKNTTDCIKNFEIIFYQNSLIIQSGVMFLNNYESISGHLLICTQ